MLDRAKLFKELTRVSNDLFVSYSDEYSCARRVWERIARDDAFAQRVASGTWSLPVPGWQGNLDEVVTLDPTCAAYRVIAVDGSQIYPDRHQGTPCYLINIGAIAMMYGTTSAQAKLYNEPYVFTDYSEQGLQASPTDLVNAVREAYEFEAGYKMVAEQPQNDRSLLLFDGSLIFWHLETKDPTFRNHFIGRYVNTLLALYDIRSVCAAYVSMPRHREVSNLIRLALCNFKLEDCAAHRAIDHVSDAHVMGFFLEPGQRSTVFSYTGALRQLYPEVVRPHFFYVHTGYEIGRVEVPAWIARDAQLCTTIASIVCDQARKGNGYPVALAEAHEQAVVKGPDREFFYHVITKFGIQRKKRIELSPKSMKKRCIGI